MLPTFRLHKLLPAILALLLASCNFPAQATRTVISLPPATRTPAPSATPTVTDTPTLVPSPTAKPTPTWAMNPPGSATVPILLYHHISDEAPGSRYYITLADFQQEMKALKDWGYTAITASVLVDALREGAPLPPRPVVITFDDGHQSVYDNAFPIMKNLGQVGVLYIVANRLESKDFMDTDELKEMISAGWEIGSHSMSHPDLTASGVNLRTEIHDSKTLLEDALGIKITSFAYPFGTINAEVANKTSSYGYLAGMGLGITWQHNLDTLYYLSRIEIYGGTDLQGFAAKLPWSGAP